MGGKRHLHTVETLATERDVDPDLLRNSRLDIGVLGPELRNSIDPRATFIVTKIEELPERVLDGVNSEFAMATLAITPTSLLRMTQHGLLSVEPARDHRIDDRNSRSEILALGARAYARALPLQSTATLVLISAAAFESASSNDEFLRMVLDETSWTVGSTEPGRVQAILAEFSSTLPRSEKQLRDWRSHPA